MISIKCALHKALVVLKNSIVILVQSLSTVGPNQAITYEDLDAQQRGLSYAVTMSHAKTIEAPRGSVSIIYLTFEV